MRQVLVVARQEIFLMRSEILPVALYWLMPLAILAFVQGGFDVYLQFSSPGQGLSGADLAAPGQATMFGFMSLAMLGYFFLGEHGWGTWDRVRSLGVRPMQIMGGKVAVAYCQQLLLFCWVVGAGALLFGLSVRGSLVALAAMELVMALAVVGYGCIACSLSGTQAQYNAFAYLGALVMAGVGGAITPFETLPGWAQTIAPAVPTYWAVRGFEIVIVDGGDLRDVTLELAVLALFAVVFFLLAWWLFDSSRRRSTWA